MSMNAELARGFTSEVVFASALRVVPSRASRVTPPAKVVETYLTAQNERAAEQARAAPRDNDGTMAHVSGDPMRPRKPLEPARLRIVKPRAIDQGGLLPGASEGSGHAWINGLGLEARSRIPPGRGRFPDLG